MLVCGQQTHVGYLRHFFAFQHIGGSQQIYSSTNINIMYYILDFHSFKLIIWDEKDFLNYLKEISYYQCMII